MLHRLLVLVLVVLACGGGSQAAPAPEIVGRREADVAGNARVSSATSGGVTESETTRRTPLPASYAVTQSTLVPVPEKWQQVPVSSTGAKSYHPIKSRGHSHPREVENRKQLNLLTGHKKRTPLGSNVAKASFHKSSPPTPSVGPVSGLAGQNAGPVAHSQQAVDVAGNAEGVASSDSAASHTVTTKHTALPRAGGVLKANPGTNTYKADMDSSMKTFFGKVPPSQTFFSKSSSKTAFHAPPTTAAPYIPPPTTVPPYTPPAATEPPHVPPPTTAAPHIPAPTTVPTFIPPPATEPPHIPPPTTAAPSVSQPTTSAPGIPEVPVGTKPEIPAHVDGTGHGAAAGGNTKIPGSQVSEISKTVSTKASVTPPGSVVQSGTGSASAGALGTEQSSTAAVKVTVETKAGGDKATQTQKTETGLLQKTEPKPEQKRASTYKPVPVIIYRSSHKASPKAASVSAVEQRSALDVPGAAPPPYRELVRRAKHHAEKVRETIDAIERARIADTLPEESAQSSDAGETRLQSATTKMPHYYKMTLSPKARKARFFTVVAPSPSQVTKTAGDGNDTETFHSVKRSAKHSEKTHVCSGSLC
nr:adult cement protein 19 [Chelonibia testudinaria]